VIKAVLAGETVKLLGPSWRGRSQLLFQPARLFELTRWSALTSIALIG